MLRVVTLKRLICHEQEDMFGTDEVRLEVRGIPGAAGLSREMIMRKNMGEDLNWVLPQVDLNGSRRSLRVVLTELEGKELLTDPLLQSDDWWGDHHDALGSITIPLGSTGSGRAHFAGEDTSAFGDYELEWTVSDPSDLGDVVDQVDLDARLEELRKNLAKVKAKAKAKLKIFERLLAAAKAEIEALKAQVRLLREQLAQCQEAKGELERKNAELQQKLDELLPD